MKAKAARRYLARNQWTIVKEHLYGKQSKKTKRQIKLAVKAINKHVKSQL